MDNKEVSGSRYKVYSTENIRLRTTRIQYQISNTSYLITNTNSY